MNRMPVFCWSLVIGVVRSFNLLLSCYYGINYPSPLLLFTGSYLLATVILTFYLCKMFKSKFMGLSSFFPANILSGLFAFALVAKDRLRCLYCKSLRFIGRPPLMKLSIMNYYLDLKSLLTSSPNTLILAPVFNIFYGCALATQLC